MFDVKTLTVGELETNCYLLSDSQSGDTYIIDPGDDADFITETILHHQLTPLAILLTHGHFDHVLGCLELKLNFNIPIYLNEKDKKLYSSANQSALHWLKKNTLKVPPIDNFLKDKQKLPLGSENVAIIETPGHTPGSISIYSSFPSQYQRRGGTSTLVGEETSQTSILFTGDTLFKDAVGRTDFSYSKPLQLTKSLEKLFKLPETTIIYPGHGEATILIDEKRKHF